MATTYKKSLKTLSITLMSGGDAITVSDTTESSAASMALAQFDQHQTMVIVGESSTLYIPFHAIAVVEVTVSESDAITKPDAVCPEPSESE